MQIEATEMFLLLDFPTSLFLELETRWCQTTNFRNPQRVSGAAQPRSPAVSARAPCTPARPQPCPCMREKVVSGSLSEQSIRRHG